MTSTATRGAVVRRRRVQIECSPPSQGGAGGVNSRCPFMAGSFGFLPFVHPQHQFPAVVLLKAPVPGLNPSHRHRHGPVPPMPLVSIKRPHHLAAWVCQSVRGKIFLPPDHCYPMEKGMVSGLDVAVVAVL